MKPSKQKFLASRREFVKKSLMLGAGVGAVAVAAGVSGFDIGKAQAAPSPSQAASGGTWQEEAGYSVLLYVDSNGHYWTKDGDTGEATDQTAAGTATAGIQEAHDLCDAGGQLRIREGDYVYSSKISFSKDIWVYCDLGVTIKKASSFGDEWGFLNTVAINLKWTGGTLDDNSTSSTHGVFLLGGSGNGEGGYPLLSCVAEDIDFINVGGSAWQCNQVSSTGTDYNQNVRWDNLTCHKTGTTIADMFELVGTNCYANVRGDNGPSDANSAVLTSAWLKNSTLVSYIQDSNGNSVDGKNFALEPYSSNGSGPYFEQVDWTGNGWCHLAHGNLASATVVAYDINLTMDDASDTILGDNANDQWHNLKIKGRNVPGSTSGFQIGNVYGLIADLEFDYRNFSSSTGSTSGVILIEDLAGDYYYFKNITIRNCVAGCLAASTPMFNMGNNSKVGHIVIDSGDILDNNGSIFTSQSDISALNNPPSLLVIKDVKGYNPIGFASSLTPTLPASGTAQANKSGGRVRVYITGIGSGITGVTITDNAGNTNAMTFTGAIGQYFELEPNDSITLAYTGSPTWKWQGL